MPLSKSSVANVAQSHGPWNLAVFDLDGTLVDTRRDLLESLESALKPEFSSAAHLERAANALHLGMRAMVVAALGDSAQDIERVAHFANRYLGDYSTRIARHSKPYPEVLDTLTWLQSRKVKMSLCSNKPRNLSHQLLQQLGLEDFFPVVVGPECTGKAKPHPDPLHYAAWESGVARARTVLIGDSSIDAECAELAGIDCWIFAGGYDPSAAARVSLSFRYFSELRQPSYWGESNLTSRTSL